MKNDMNFSHSSNQDSEISNHNTDCYKALDGATEVESNISGGLTIDQRVGRLEKVLFDPLGQNPRSPGGPTIDQRLGKIEREVYGIAKHSPPAPGELTLTQRLERLESFSPISMSISRANRTYCAPIPVSQQKNVPLNLQPLRREVWTPSQIPSYPPGTPLSVILDDPNIPVQADTRTREERSQQIEEGLDNIEKRSNEMRQGKLTRFEEVELSCAIQLWEHTLAAYHKDFPPSISKIQPQAKETISIGKETADSKLIEEPVQKSAQDHSKDNLPYIRSQVKDDAEAAKASGSHTSSVQDLLEKPTIADKGKDTIKTEEAKDNTPTLVAESASPPTIDEDSDTEIDNHFNVVNTENN